MSFKEVKIVFASTALVLFLLGMSPNYIDAENANVVTNFLLDFNKNFYPTSIAIISAIFCYLSHKMEEFFY